MYLLQHNSSIKIWHLYMLLFCQEYYLWSGYSSMTKPIASYLYRLSILHSTNFTLTGLALYAGLVSRLVCFRLPDRISAKAGLIKWKSVINR